MKKPIGYCITEQTFKSIVDRDDDTHDIIIHFDVHYYNGTDGSISVRVILPGITRFVVEIQSTLEYSMNQELNDLSIEYLRLKILDAVKEELYS